jgi:hypothetical protein
LGHPAVDTTPFHPVTLRSPLFDLFNRVWRVQSHQLVVPRPFDQELSDHCAGLVIDVLE